MRRSGLPSPFIGPLEFAFGGRVSESDRQAINRVESIRQSIADQDRSFDVRNRRGEPRQLTAAQLARGVSVDPHWGAFLYLCSHAFRARTIVELGACVGISGSFLASSEHCEQFLTIEASRDLASLATINLGKIGDHTRVVTAQFDDALDQILPSLQRGIDLAFIDGHHEYDATLHYFGRLEHSLNPGALVIFDDIHLSEGMWSAWQLLRRRPGFSHAVSIGRFGLCRWDGSTSKPVSHDLCPYVGCLRVTPQWLQLALQPS